MNPVEILTIKTKIPLFKGEDQANAIELIQLEEVGFEIVAQKGLYEVGDKAVYIQPDYSLSNIPLFESFIQPNGDPSKSRLGSNNRIRAIKFNLHRGDNMPVYSVGILLPKIEVENYIMTHSLNLKSINEIEELDKCLGITKWEAPETNSGGLKSGSSRNFPADMYKTDEENINNLWNKIQYPITLIGTEKCDGSSISIFVRGNESGICSRKWLKPFTTMRVVGRRDMTIKDRLHQIIFNLGLTKTILDLNIREEVQEDNDFIKIGKPYHDKLVEYCNKNNQDLVLRGELNGKNLKGSGNKNNPSKNDEPNIKFFGLDDFSGFSKKEPEFLFDHVIEKLGFERCKVVFHEEFNSREEIEQKCNNYFKDNLIEGIVVRTPMSDFSAKFMNLEYDAKK